MTLGHGRRPFTCHACQGCRYVHTFLPGLIQVWPAKDGYPQ
ncbi:MAG TPA: hypothetical protein VMU94_02710 [Streptosporangiaceae bacterium]|nr:hypothetical protein [Streptosporangiaceae bacterium]